MFPQQRYLTTTTTSDNIDSDSESRGSTRACCWLLQRLVRRLVSFLWHVVRTVMFRNTTGDENWWSFCTIFVYLPIFIALTFLLVGGSSDDRNHYNYSEHDTTTTMTVVNMMLHHKDETSPQEIRPDVTEDGTSLDDNYSTATSCSSSWHEYTDVTAISSTPTTFSKDFNDDAEACYFPYYNVLSPEWITSGLSFSILLLVLTITTTVHHLIAWYRFWMVWNLIRDHNSTTATAAASTRMRRTMTTTTTLHPSTNHHRIQPHAVNMATMRTFRQQKDDYDKDCPICLHSLQQQRHSKQTPTPASNTMMVQCPCCQTLFHKECFAEWFDRHNDPQEATCPCCRSVVSFTETLPCALPSGS